jgi:hypothetical protein
MRDYSPRSYLSGEVLQRIDGVETWIESSQGTSGIEGALRPDIPLINLRGSFDLIPFRERFHEHIRGSEPKKMLSLVPNAQVQQSLKYIKDRGFDIGQTTPIMVPFFSRRIVMSLVAVEVLPGSASQAHPNDHQAPATTLPNGAYLARIAIEAAPSTLKAGSTYQLRFNLRNASSFVWPVEPGKDGRPVLRLGNHWLDSSGQLLIRDDARAPIDRPLNPGDGIALTLSVRTPAKPGNYVLEIDVVHEWVAWFADKGSKTLRMAVHAVE